MLVAGISHMFNESEQSSEAGERWRTYYRSGELTWFVPEYADCTYMRRFARTEWIQRILKHARISAGAGMRLLEAGCGTGMYAVALAALGFTVDAFDYNAEAVELAISIAARTRDCADERVSLYNRVVLG